MSFKILALSIMILGITNIVTLSVLVANKPSAPVSTEAAAAKSQAVTTDENEVLKLNPEDFTIDTSSSSGAANQSTDSDVLINTINSGDFSVDK